MAEAGLPSAMRVSMERARFGAAALAIRDAELLKRRVDRADLVGSGKSRPVVVARQSIAFRAWTECLYLSLSGVAGLIGRSDHSAAAHAILAGVRARGIIVAKVSDLRRPAGDPVDWVKLAYAAAGWRAGEDLTIEQAARRAGIGRIEWRKAEQGRSIAAGTLLAVCRAIGLPPLRLLPPVAVAEPVDVMPPPTAGRPISHETDGKHG